MEDSTRAAAGARERSKRCLAVCSPTGNFSSYAGAVSVRRGDGFQLVGDHAREHDGNGSYFLVRQILWIAIGIAGMFWLMNTDYRKLRQPPVIFTAFR